MTQGDSMEPEEDQIKEHINQHPPSCISAFRLSPAEPPEKIDVYFKSAYQLACNCGNNEGTILGYPLNQYNSEYHGPDFITPLSFSCSACSAISQILDTGIHGYHAEVARLEGSRGSCHMRGTGEPSRFLCPQCSESIFSVIVGFVFWHFDIIYDEPDLPAQQFFNEFLIYQRCKNCRKVSSAVHLGKL